MSNVVRIDQRERAELEPARIPPHDPDAEAAVISAVLIDPTKLTLIIDFLRPEHMFSEAHRRIYEAAVELFRAGAPIDAVTIVSWLRDRNRLAQVGNSAYVASIMDASPAIANVRAHAVTVHDNWRRRQVIFACQRIAAQGTIAVPDVQGWCEQAIRDLAKVGSDNPVRPVESNEQALHRMLAEVFDVPAADDAAGATGRSVTGFPSGIHGLDAILGGCHKGAKTTIAATTGAGKTTLGLQLAVRWAKRGIGVLFFSTEMKRQSLLLRAVCAESGVPMDRIKARRLTSSDRLALTMAAETIRALPLTIDETARLTIEELSSAAKAAAERMPLVDRVPLGAVFVDYAQRLEPARHLAHRDAKDQIAHSTKQFKLLCQELDIAGVELAQAKPLERGKRRERPHASNGIADSSQIAKEADNVVFLVNESEATPSDPRQEVTAYVAKQRDGRKGEVALLLRGDIFTFIDPNTPNPMASPSRQYVDPNPELFDDGADTLTRDL